MPDELAEQGLGRPAERRKVTTTIQKFILGLLLVMGLGLIATFQQNQDIKAGQREQRQTQLQGIQRGYVNRAVTCDLQKGLGLHESESCNDREIAKYRDPLTGKSSSTGASESKMTRELVCLVLKQSAKQPGSHMVIPPAYCPDE